ncbi:MAG: hypothetical protein GX858_04030, partial [Clostridiales bacterium]|nr:hypothetical protein [Clostridiales bacterium]
MKNLLHSFEGEIVEIDLDDDENSWTGRIAKVFENDVLIVNIDKYGRELAWIAVSIENILLVRSNSNRLNMINGIYPAERQKEYLTSGYSSAAEFLLKYAVERNAYLNVSFKNASCELFAKGLSI